MHGACIEYVLTNTCRYLQLFLQLAYQLQRCQDDIAAQRGMWGAMSSGSGLVAEQLAYVAALAVDAALVYCDRPKAETYEPCRHECMGEHHAFTGTDGCFGRRARSTSIMPLDGHPGATTR